MQARTLPFSLGLYSCRATTRAERWDLIQADPARCAIITASEGPRIEVCALMTVV